EEELDMPVAVPGERGDTASRLDAQLLEHPPDTDGAVGDLAPRPAVDASRRCRHDLDLTAEIECMPQDEVQRQRERLHQALHRVLFQEAIERSIRLPD